MIQWLQDNRRFLLAVLLIGVVRGSLADHYVVPSGSMEPTLLPGDRVLVDKRAYGMHLPFTAIRFGTGTPVARGDIVIFDEPNEGTRLIKRVVAIGGDVVAVHAGRVSINGDFLAPNAAAAVEDFGHRQAHLDLSHGGGPDVAPIRVPPGQVLVLGDARGNSRDGRWFGFVAERSLYAKALGVYYRSGEGPVWLML